MSVIVDGLPVKFGETISRTGVMLVRADDGFIVRQDDVEWTPVGYVDGAAQYVINSNGRISVLVDDKEVFYFLVALERDFVFSANNLYQLENDAIVSQRGNPSSYVQARFNGRTNKLYVYVQPSSVDVATLMAMTTFCNQDVTVDKTVFESVWVKYTVTGFDISSYLQFSVGNVLLDFITPA